LVFLLAFFCALAYSSEPISEASSPEGRTLGENLDLLESYLVSLENSNRLAQDELRSLKQIISDSRSIIVAQAGRLIDLLSWQEEMRRISQAQLRYSEELRSRYESFRLLTWIAAPLLAGAAGYLGYRVGR
jgi:hypothetical protein